MEALAIEGLVHAVGELALACGGEQMLVSSGS